jgi:hypothetical protein
MSYSSCKNAARSSGIGDQAMAALKDPFCSLGYHKRPDLSSVTNRKSRVSIDALCGFEKY